MKNTKTVTVRIPPELREGLETIQERDGVPISEQFRRGIRLWLAQKQMPAKKRGRSVADAT